MARKFAEPIDLSQLEILNVRLQQLGSDPGSPVEGQIWYNTAVHRPRWRSNSANVDIYPSDTASTANTNVLRDGSGNFSAGTITAALTGTASQATTLDDGTTTYRSGSYYLNFANSTGTRTHTAISDFDTQVRTSRLDQMAAPTASVSFNSQNITSLLDPVNPQDAATKAYVDANSQGLDIKASVRVATAASLPAYTRTTNVITATSNGALAAVDGVTLVLNDRLLVKNGASGVDNGIYYVSQVGDASHPYTLTRATDADTSAKVTAGMFTFVEEGTANADTGWVLTTNNPIVLNTTSLTFAQFSGAGTYTAGNGLTLTGNQFSLNVTARFSLGASLDLASSIVTPGTYTSVTVDTYGRTTAGADIITSNGGVYRTASGTFTARTITGTASRITVTNGDGVAGAPTIDINASYVGQSTITTLGTIGTGTWQGSAVAAQYGGTSVNGATAANGTLLIGNGSGYTLATLTNGTNISITNGSGTITINTSATVLTGTLVSGRVPFANGTQSLTDSANMTYATATGLAVSSGSAPLALTQSAQSSGSPTAFAVTGGAHTTLTASSEAISANFNFAQTVQFATGALATQRAVVFQAPTYAFVASSTLTTAATVAITNAPQQGTNATITNAYALWVQAGNVLFAGALNVTGAETVSGLLTLQTATSNLTITQGAASSGSPTSLTYTGGAHTTLTASAEASDIVINAARTVQFATGALTTQRAVRIAAPTYAFVGSSTLTNAATFAISGAPVAGTNATLTNSWALWVQGGTSRFDGQVNVTTSTSPIVVTQGAASSGSPTGFLFTGGAHTALTASTEAIDVNWSLNRTVQFATGALTTQRAFVVQAPTYGFVGSTTLTTAATFAITGSPAAGTNATITNAYALWVQAGISRFDGNLSINDAVNVVLGTSTGTQIGTSTSQKLGFYGVTPVVQQTGDIRTGLAALGLLTTATLALANVTGTLSATNGGTGFNGGSAANGALPIGNGSGFSLATLTAGSGINITNGSGTITITATGSGTLVKYATSIGDGTTTSFTVTHGLGTLDVLVTIYDNSTGAEITTDVIHATTNTLTVNFAVAPTTNQYRVVVGG